MNGFLQTPSWFDDFLSVLTITLADHPSNYVAVTAFPCFTVASSKRRLDQAYYMVDVDNRGITAD